MSHSTHVGFNAPYFPDIFKPSGEPFALLTSKATLAKDGEFLKCALLSAYIAPTIVVGVG